MKSTMQKVGSAWVVAESDVATNSEDIVHHFDGEFIYLFCSLIVSEGQ